MKYLPTRILLAVILALLSPLALNLVAFADNYEFESFDELDSWTIYNSSGVQVEDGLLKISRTSDNRIPFLFNTDPFTDDEAGNEYSATIFYTDLTQYGNGLAFTDH